MKNCSSAQNVDHRAAIPKGCIETSKFVSFNCPGCGTKLEFQYCAPFDLELSEEGKDFMCCTDCRKQLVDTRNQRF